MPSPKRDVSSGNERGLGPCLRCLGTLQATGSLDCISSHAFPFPLRPLAWHILEQDKHSHTLRPRRTSTSLNKPRILLPLTLFVPDSPLRMTFPHPTSHPIHPSLIVKTLRSLRSCLLREAIPSQKGTPSPCSQNSSFGSLQYHI